MSTLTPSPGRAPTPARACASAPPMPVVPRPFGPDRVHGLRCMIREHLDVVLAWPKLRIKTGPLAGINNGRTPSAIAAVLSRRCPIQRRNPSEMHQSPPRRVRSRQRGGAPARDTPKRGLQGAPFRCLTIFSQRENAGKPRRAAASASRRPHPAPPHQAAEHWGVGSARRPHSRWRPSSPRRRTTSRSSSAQ